MKISRIGTTIVAVVAGMLLVGGVARAGVAGVVTAVTQREITVSGAVYALDQDTSIEDLAGHPISLPELRPGVPVELDFDEAGKLATVRAAVVR